MLLSIRDVAARCRVSTMTVRRWWYRGILPNPVKTGGLVRWRSEDIDQWLESRQPWTAEDAKQVQPSSK